MDYAENEPKPSSSTAVDVSDEENEEIPEAGEQDSDPNLVIEDSGSDEGGGDPGKWTTKEVSTLLDVYKNFKPQFDEPYAVKFRIWKKILKIPEIVATGKSCFQLSKKIDNLKKTWRKMKRPFAKANSNWRWTEKMDLIFGDDPAIELNDVAEVGDGGPKKKAPAVKNSSNWKTQLVAIEKERVDVLKDIARSQTIMIYENGRIALLTQN
ncbi:hypothetical protein DAPPUDRAFT_317890 [Daphnia pulex]|uniref:Myb/SANT-like DNA-binding domain-containing protein n=1 Tax=Daphnia pulex TaxID=6669 RepID=E9GH95_DAPPU|nr:hypothetical protein DAPPUDRAFT_317890 [Daphnia pulex]|eukprot:EFX81159.1 hypothetical protein DAPPUDRAFT_317890 [Daphnia pulex]